MPKAIRYLIVAVLAAGLAGCATSGMSGTTQTQANANLAANAASLLQRQMAFPPENRIPQELIANAQCIAVFPSVIQAGFIVGGRRGMGLVSCQQPSGGWAHAAPAVYTLTGASVGLQAGVQKSSVILLFMTQRSTQALRNGKLKLGAGLAVTAGPIGFNADVDSAPSPVMAYVTSKTGLFAGVHLAGSRLSFSDSENARLYSDMTTAHQILFGSVTAPVSMNRYMNTMQQYASAMP